MDWRNLAARLFPAGHRIEQRGDLLVGEADAGGTTVAVVGSTNHAEAGVELALATARVVLDTLRDHPGRPIVFLVDTSGQRLRRRDELLGLHRAMAHLAKCVEVARARGHRTVALVYDQALSGGFLATGMMADVCAALPDAEIRVMNLPAMARVTRQPVERLQALAATSPVFAPGAINYVRMGAIDAIWDGDLAARLAESLARAPAGVGDDPRADAGLARGGRALAAPVAARVARG